MPHTKLAKRLAPQLWVYGHSHNDPDLFAKRVSLFSEPTPEKLFVRLSEDQATRLGAELLGEGIVWSLGLATLAYQSSEDDEAEQKLEARISSLEATLRRERQSVGSPSLLFIPG